MSETQLAIELSKGNSSAVADLLQTHGSFVFTIINRILLNTTESEEATQDVFMKIIKSIQNYDPTSSFKAWVYAIAYRTAIDYTRKRKKGQSTIEGLAIDSQSYADTEINEHEQKIKISQLLTHLDLESRNIVTLYYLEEKNIKEITLLTGMSESNIKTKLFRARKELANHVHKYIDHE
jgi:RNA polymerase sigma-70 factor, ECF subfamily